MPEAVRVAPAVDAADAASSAAVVEDRHSLNPQSNPNFVPRSLGRYTVRKSQGTGDGMKFGFYLPTHGPTAHPSALKQIARRGDELGYSYMVAGDHIIAPKQVQSSYPYSVGGQVPWGAEGDHLEQLTALAFLAAVTERIRIVPSVMIVPHRNPLVAAKMLATMDVLSEGRLTVGVGVGWMQEEFEALDTPPFNRRGAVTDEYLRIFKELWTSDAPAYDGEFYSFADIDFSPKPVQSPHPPIWVL